MRNTNKLVIICLLCSVIKLGLCKNVAVEKQLDEDEYQDDEYDYGEDYDESKSHENKNSSPTLETNIITSPPYFEQSEIEIHAKPGDDVLMNCDVRNFQISNVVLWYKQQKLLTSGQFSMTERVEIMRNNTILIRNVNSDDAGDYYCEILPQKVRMQARLIIGESLSITIDGRDVTNRAVTLKQGGLHTLECKTYLPTTAKIVWSLNGQRAENIVTKVDGGKLIIDNIDDGEAGVYQCLADDGSADLPHGMVTIDVHYSPKASTHRHHVNTEAGQNAELYCDYKANPIARTHWVKNGRPLSFSDKYAMKTSMHKHQNRTILIVKDVNVNDLGDYECLAENSLGSSSVRVQLTYEPENPQFEDIKIDGRKVTLHWLVRSMQPLSEAILDYKMNGAYSWSTVSVLHTQRHTEHSGVWKIAHEMEFPAGEWHTRVKAKNKIGWSKFSPQHDFVVKDEEDEVEDEPNAPPEDLVMAGLGGGGRTSASLQLKIGGSVLSVSLLCLTLLQQFVPSL